ncbi:hypothetical protein LTR17_027658 [Elasticomyces elasticus]|nr:hypothetical protein LTR17_027658 [Elasticomyces elasticus]
MYRLVSGSKQDAASLRPDIDRVVTTVKSWFEGREGRWLLAFDNADSLDDESDPYFVDLQHYLPDAPGVEIFVTTRSRTAVDITELAAVEVGKLALAEAIEMFVHCAKLVTPTEAALKEAALIAVELDYLALALTLAGAYVAATPRIRSNIAEYLPEYRHRRKALLSRKAKQQIHQYGESVLSTWETSCAAIAKQCPVAIRLLSFLAFLDPDDIFLELFRCETDSAMAESEPQEDDWRDFLSPDVSFEEVFDEALEALSLYSLIQWKEEQGGYSMHKLVHARGFDRLEAEEQGQYSRSSLVFLESVTWGGQLDLVRKSRITPHISASVTRLREWRRTSTQVPARSLDIVCTLANFIRDVGQYHSEYELRAFEKVEREQQKEQYKTGWLLSLSSLALVLNDLGNYDAAVLMAKQALEGYDKVNAPKHLATLILRNNIAVVLQRQGNYEEAETMYQRLIEVKETELGEEHTSTITSIGNLATLLQYQGKYEAAEVMIRRALEGYEKVLGKEHPDTLTSVGNLAGVLQSQGQYEAGEEMNRRVLEGREKVLGKEHPQTLMSVGNLAQGSEKVLGKEHPSTLASVGNLALVLRYQGEYEAAEAMSRRALEGYEKVLGKEHPNTLTSISTLAQVLKDQGKYEAAEAMNRRALEGSEKVLGKEHPSTLTSVGNLALVLQYQGEYEAAEAMNRRALEGREKVLGKEHPDTLTRVGNLALVLQYQGEYEAAKAMSRRALEGREKVLGKEHPSTLTSVGHLALVLQYQGEYGAAEAMSRRALEGYEKVLGKEHPDTLTSVSILAYLLHQKADFTAAMRLYERACSGYVLTLGPSHPTTTSCIDDMSSLRDRMTAQRAE